MIINLYFCVFKNKTNMKRLLTFACCLIGGVSAFAQDVLITQEGDVKKVYDVEVGPSTVFYKESDKADAPTLRIKKTDVIMIKKKDGTKFDLGNGNTTLIDKKQQLSQSKNFSPVSASISSDAQRLNEEAIKKINDFSPKYAGKDTDKPCKRILCVLGYSEDSHLVNDDIEIECVTGSLNFDSFKKGINDAISNGVVNSNVPFEKLGSPYYLCPAIKLRLKNRSSKPLFIDLGNTFMIRKGVATAYYVPSSTSTTSSSSSGASVNLGAVAGAFGIGGALGTLAGGIGVGGGSTSGAVNTTYSQRVIAVPPMSVKELDAQLMFQDLDIYCEGLNIQGYGNNDYYRMPEFSFETKELGKYLNGETHSFSEATSPVKFGFFVSYSDNEACQNEKNMSLNLYLRQMIGFDKTYNDMGRGARLLSKSIPDFNKCPCFVGAVIEGGLLKRLPKGSVFKRGDK